MNLTIEQMREIVDEAPVGATDFLHDTYFQKRNAVEWCYWEEDQWKFTSYSERFKHLLVCLGDLRATIADHDRTDHVDFKVGDKVVFDAHFCDEHKGSGYGEITYCTMDKRVFEIDSYYLVSIDEIRHATLDEIRVGHRIDANTDYVTDIKNHISPMTIVQGD